MLEHKLLAIPAGRWIVDQVVVLDWYDGPRRGLCALAHPVAEFLFDLVDEELNSDGLDLRILRLSELPAGSVLSAADELNALGPGPMLKPVWVPIWKFATAEAREQAEKRIESLEAGARQTDLLISTTDMIHFTSCWQFGCQRPDTNRMSHVGGALDSTHPAMEPTRLGEP